MVMRFLRYLRHLVAHFFVGILVFFAPFVAIVLFVIIGLPFFVSVMMLLWAAVNGFLWLAMHDPYLRQPTLFWFGVSIVSFALGWVMLIMLQDLAHWLTNPRRPVDASLEMALTDEGRY